MDATRILVMHDLMRPKRLDIVLQPQLLPRPKVRLDLNLLTVQEVHGLQEVFLIG